MKKLFIIASLLTACASAPVPKPCPPVPARECVETRDMLKQCVESLNTTWGLDFNEALNPSLTCEEVDQSFGFCLGVYTTLNALVGV